jgi:type II secretory pathway component GspD/PulD (secretin)
MVRRLFVLLLLLTPLLAGAEQQVLEVIPLGYRQADEVIPMLRPLIAPGGTITGMKNQLVVRTTPSNLAEIKQVLATVDSAPRRLMISVRQASGIDTAREAGSVQGNVAIGDHARVTVPGRRTPDQSTVTVQTGRNRVEGNVASTQSARSDEVTQTVQVLEGGSAFIRTGQSVVVPNSQVIDTPNGRRYVHGGDTVQADTGFYVTPRVSGERVMLDISTSRERMRNPSNGTISGERIGTQVSGRLGEWIEIGGTSQSMEREQGEILSRSRDARSSDSRVLLKVDEVR